jgi:hypothetical protein
MISPCLLHRNPNHSRTLSFTPEWCPSAPRCDALGGVSSMAEGAPKAQNAMVILDRFIIVNAIRHHLM